LDNLTNEIRIPEQGKNSFLKQSYSRVFLFFFFFSFTRLNPAQIHIPTCFQAPDAG
jgi:hypothetical protein